MTGVEERHQQRCATRRRGASRCDCRRSYRGVVWDKRAARNRAGPWGARTEAVAWRAKALQELAAGTLPASAGPTLRDKWHQFHEGAKSGTIRERKGGAYKPATLRGYERAWRLRIDRDLGARRLGELRRRDVQAFVDRMAEAGTSASTILNTLDPLRAIYRRALQRETVAANPTAGVELPKPAGGVERFATREEATALVDALPEGERALWATAFYGGLRSGELGALRWKDVDLDAGLLHVRRSWDDDAGEIEPKTKGSKRRVPIVPALADRLRTHRELTSRSGDDLVFGRTAREPFLRSTTRRRARAAWKTAKLTPITLHECRHTAASLMIAAGANAKALSTVMGHASISITFDRYGKLMPGGESEVGKLLAEYLRG
jgi:integrase